MKTIFRYIFKPLHLAIISLALIFVIIGCENYFFTNSYRKSLFNDFQNQFLGQQKRFELELTILNLTFKNGGTNKIFTNELVKLNTLASQNFMYFFIYRNDSMLFWSNNRVGEADILPAIAFDNRLLQLSNGWFYVQTINTQHYEIIGLLLLKNNFSIQNQFLENDFNPYFKIPREVKIKPKSPRSDFNVRNEQGQAVFSLVFEKNYNSEHNKFLVILCFIVSVLSIFLLYGELIKTRKNKWIKLVIVIAGGFALLLLKYLMVLYKFPDAIYKLSLFQPTHFAISNMLPSLGDLFLASCIVFIIAFYFYKFFQIQFPRKWIKKYLFYLANILVLSFTLIYFLYANELFENIIYNSNMSFYFQDSFAVSYITVFGILSIALLFTVFVFISDILINYFFSYLSYLETILITIGTILIVLVLYYLKYADFDPATPIIIILCFTIIIYVRKFKKHNFSYRNIVLLIFAFSFYTVYTIYQVTEEKAKNEKKLLAINLASEHDPIAEYLFIDLLKEIRSDSTIFEFSLQNKIDYPWIFRYIHKKYFSGYWERYDLQLTLCNPGDSVLIKPEIIYKPCYTFFENLIHRNAEKISGSGFYFLKNSNGRISYISEITYFDFVRQKKANIYLQLDSKQTSEDVGYPELLIDDRYTRDKRKFGYSYAKYYKNRLITQSGNFPYYINSKEYPAPVNEFTFAKFNDYGHIIFKPDKDNLIILSKPLVGFFDFLVSFSYIFIFYFALLNLLLFIAGSNLIQFKLKNDFKTKIRLSFIGVLIVSLVGVGGLTLYMIIKQYRSRYYERITEKLQSINTELENNLSDEGTIYYTWSSYDYNNLEELLRKLSNVFSIDINLYDRVGKLIATSRPEIFDKGIQDDYMNPIAYKELALKERTEYTQYERVGKLQYLSVYSPFINNKDQTVAYLNLPYFTSQSVLSRRISALLLAITNFYVFLILLSVIFAVLIAEQITKPLRFIQEKFASIKLGPKSEKIIYNRNDEIGSLVQEYNRMVEELDRSVDMLAKSERETAWREMAKQVAHEIKNPLTPMRLSIQQLQRAWKDKIENIDEYMNEVTKIIIEQIDNLSNIATEFSNFAKMPKTNTENFDLCHLISGIIKLFSESGAIFEFTFNDNGYIINADKEQISRVFINLANNAIQAIPKNRQGKIEITVTRNNNNVIITFSDDGTGIPDEMKDKLFQPNFTTKSGGSGLGLAISKSIIENAGGHITFETEAGKGTTFIITLPKAQ
jgi:two-component system, NtrC family, nitrogen regulation sensor histidine kinase NtrY